MKALSIIEEMTFDSEFAAAAGTCIWHKDYISEEGFCREMFGCKIKEGLIEDGQNYLYLYQSDAENCVRALYMMEKPDVILESIYPEDDSFGGNDVFLWKIE